MSSHTPVMKILKKSTKQVSDESMSLVPCRQQIILVTSSAGSLRNRRAHVLNAALSLSIMTNTAIKEDP